MLLKTNMMRGAEEDATKTISSRTKSAKRAGTRDRRGFSRRLKTEI